MEYTEHKKLEIFSEDQMSALNEFCEYLDANVEAQFVDTENKPKISSSQDILYDFLGIDKHQLELERKEILKAYQ